MNVVVYLGSFDGKSDIYKKAARNLGELIGKRGDNLYYGGSNVGLMGALADGAIEAGGKVYGVEPKFFVDAEVQHEKLTKLIVTKTMAERKSLLIEKGDAFIAFPGGIGTLEEIAEVMTLNKVGIIKKPFYFFNLNGYYEPFKAFLKYMVDNGFLEEEFYNSLVFLSTIEELDKELKKL